MGEPLSLDDLTDETPPWRFGRLDILNGDRPGRAGLERFIEARYRQAFGARLAAHYPILVAVNGADGAPRAAAGVRFAEAGPLFLESYLEAVIEQAVGAPRTAIVEIGSLASVSAPATLDLLSALASWLGGPCGRRFAVATLRPDLARLLDRAGFGLRPIAAADPARLGETARSWGDYYQAAPQVFAGAIGSPPTLGRLALRRAAAADVRAVTP